MTTFLAIVVALIVGFACGALMRREDSRCQERDLRSMRHRLSRATDTLFEVVRRNTPPSLRNHR